jgi:F-type H+-transporting ATPase subunit gamma
MSDTIASLQRHINSASDLQSVVRTMKAIAASSIGQYEHAVRGLVDYDRGVELGLSAWLRANGPSAGLLKDTPQRDDESVGAIVFGSDQGLVGKFNDVVADFAIKKLAKLSGTPRFWAVGERVYARMADAGLKPVGLLSVPNSVKAITPLVHQIQLDIESHHLQGVHTSLYVFHNRPRATAVFQPVSKRVLPLDAAWARRLTQVVWPTKSLPEVIDAGGTILNSLIREYFFVSLFRACAESLASENASRLAAMQRAEKNIDELMETLRARFHQLRQSSIDAELFDVVSGFEALTRR